MLFWAMLANKLETSEVTWEHWEQKEVSDGDTRHSLGPQLDYCLEKKVLKS